MQTLNSGEAFVIGVDFGTDSVRSVLVDCANGAEMAQAVFNYPRWQKGLYCDPGANLFRQHPLDYIEGLESTISECVRKAGDDVSSRIKAISIDTTGSTPVAVNRQGVPLALTKEFNDNPNAMFVLWKDHTATREAAEINALSEANGGKFLQYVGGVYSSEWFWAKLLHILREDETIRRAIFTWVEHCDWIPFLLTGANDASELKRGICSAGHKALWSDVFGGLPPDEFFASIDPLLKGFNETFQTETYSADRSAGELSDEWKRRLGLSGNVLVGIGAMDAHMGAVGGQIEPYYLSKVMGTSTCDMLVAPLSETADIVVKGICGQVKGSVIPGMMGMEAGQSAFGDVYAWFRNLLGYSLNYIDDQQLRQRIMDKMITRLSEEASKLPLRENDELAVDWLNGRRTPNANQLLKCAIVDINLASDAPRIFKALVEATCFGARAIVETFVDQGVPIKGLIGLGGVAKKSPYVMQVMADVINMPIKIHRSEQTCASGAAMFAATVAGLYQNVEDAMNAMGQGFEMEYFPDRSRNLVYNKRFQKYKKLGTFLESRINSQGQNQL